MHTPSTVKRKKTDKSRRLIGLLLASFLRRRLIHRLLISAISVCLLFLFIMLSLFAPSPFIVNALHPSTSTTFYFIYNICFSSLHSSVLCVTLIVFQENDLVKSRLDSHQQQSPFHIPVIKQPSHLFFLCILCYVANIDLLFVYWNLKANEATYRHDLWNSRNSQLFSACSNAGVNFASKLHPRLPVLFSSHEL
jgi:hypothetical protein